MGIRFPMRRLAPWVLVKGPRARGRKDHRSLDPIGLLGGGVLGRSRSHGRVRPRFSRRLVFFRSAPATRIGAARKRMREIAHPGFCGGPGLPAFRPRRRAHAGAPMPRGDALNPVFVIGLGALFIEPRQGQQEGLFQRPPESRKTFSATRFGEANRQSTANRAAPATGRFIIAPAVPTMGVGFSLRASP